MHTSLRISLTLITGHSLKDLLIYFMNLHEMYMGCLLNYAFFNPIPKQTNAKQFYNMSRNPFHAISTVKNQTETRSKSICTLHTYIFIDDTCILYTLL